MGSLVPKRRFLSPLCPSKSHPSKSRSTPKSDWGLVRAWCGPGNPGLGTGLQPQSCAGSHSCATHRIALMHYQQLWLGAVLARAQPCDGAGPAVELPGFRHVIDAHKEGQAACEAPASLRHSSSCCDLGRCREDRHRYNAAALGWAQRADRPVRPGIARSRCAAAAARRRRTLLSASGRCCVKEPHFPEKLLRSRARRPARPL